MTNLTSTNLNVEIIEPNAEQHTNLNVEIVEPNDEVVEPNDEIVEPNAFVFYDTKLPVFETLGAKCNKCFSDLYILHDCMDYESLPLNYNGYRTRPKRTRASLPEHRAKLCRCGNLGIQLDEDNHLYVYVDNICTASLTMYYISRVPNKEYIYKYPYPRPQDYSIIYAERLGESESFLYVDYKPVKSTKHSSKKKYKRIPYVRKTKPGNTKLLHVLTRYNNFYSNKGWTQRGIAK